MQAPRRPLTFVAAGAALALLVSCAGSALQVDRSARAPRLDGHGDATLAATTASEPARRLFAQGVAQAYAFNEVEAVRMFKAALAADPDCALCAWGVAWQLGPIINNPDRGDLTEALRYVDLALRHADGVSDKERLLIQAMALRYAHDSQSRLAAVLTAPVCGPGGAERADPLDLAYAERLHELVERYPGDPDVLSLYAEAAMVATRGDWWDADTGQAQGRIGELATWLETAAARHPRHTGVNHYLIHAVDTPGQAARAVPAADRLGALAPKSPHLLHMPSHTFGLVGRYADATRVNQQALAADDALDGALAAQGFSITKDWRGHNGAYLWFAALMEGRGDVALAAARASAARAEKTDDEFAEYTRARPVLTLLRLERWDAVLAEPLPRGDKGVATVLGQQSRGIALVRTGRLAEATAALAALEPVADRMIKANPGDGYFNKVLRGLAEVSRTRLRAEIALAEGRAEAALTQQAAGVQAGKFLDGAEPPMLATSSLLALGDLQLRAQHWPEAEQSFRADLAVHPNSGWALRGLLQALQAQGKPSSELAGVKRQLVASFAAADAGLSGLK